MEATVNHAIVSMALVMTPQKGMESVPVIMGLQASTVISVCYLIVTLLLDLITMTSVRFLGQ
jgi:hypothetical protein